MGGDVQVVDSVEQKKKNTKIFKDWPSQDKAKNGNNSVPHPINYLPNGSFRVHSMCE